jgi:hypothetical protein
VRLLRALAPAATARFAALATGNGGQVTILRERALLARNGRPSLASNLAPQFGTHRRKAATGLWFRISHNHFSQS